MIDEIEALPCPFCGEGDPDFEFSNEAQEECWIQCQGCLCQGPVATIGCRDDEDGEIDLVAEATELWNTRPPHLRLVGDTATSPTVPDSSTGGNQ